MENNFEKISFLNAEAIENKEEMERKEKLKDVYEDLFERELFPLKVLQGSEIIDLTADKELYGVTSKRPFVVLEVGRIGEIDENKEIKRVIYKGEIKDAGPFQSIKKEEIIYRDVLPEIYKNLPENIREKVAFPRLIDVIKRNGETKAIILEKLDGIICGDHNTSKESIWDKKDIETICCLIKEFQKIDPEEIKKNFPELPERDFLKVYKERLKERIEPVRKLLGEEYEKKMKELLQISEEIIEKQASTLLSEDIFCFNTIKMPNGRLGFIDWERPYIGKDVSADYGKLISRLWTNPELQKEAIKTALEINQENPYFKDMLRASLVLLEGGHMFRHYFKRLEDDDLRKRKEAEKAVGVFKKLFKDILDNKGIWQE
ncbi:MAG: hypothetical protein DRM99_05605 [Thermoplasmata archaeon]|nr:MAG: hypothetical protein DRM99_05605 [Thermoplasmata archaeon]